MKKISLILVLAVVLFFSTGVYASYKVLQKFALTRAFSSLEVELQVITAEKDELNNLYVIEALNAKNMLKELKAGVTSWSSVVSAIRKTVPVKGGKALLDVLSYSGGEGNKISMNVTTKALSSDPYEDMAKFLQSFDDSPNFVGSFIPSVSSGYDDEGNEVLNFLFSTTYVEGSANLLRKQ